MASFSVPLLSICRGKLHRQVHVCDLLISYNHSPSTFTAVHPCRIPWPTIRRSWKEILQDRLHLVYVADARASYPLNERGTLDSRSDTYYVVATPHQPFYQLNLRVLGVMYIVILSLTSSMRPSFTVQLKFDVVHVRLASKTSVYQELLIAIECSAIISTILTNIGLIPNPPPKG